MNEAFRCAVLMTCHNRKEKTRQCLQMLFSQKLPMEVSIEVFLVDDASTDGTSVMVQDEFPQVHLIQGTGNLYWNRGMYMAWEFAASSTPDGYLWLNDGTYLFPDAVARIHAAALDCALSSIIVGTTAAINDDTITYGGYKNGSSTPLAPDGTNQSCDYFNGNVVLVPKKVFLKLGNLLRLFRHGLGDFEYGMRAKDMGIECFVAPVVIGRCDRHETLPQWCDPQISLTKRLSSFYHPLGAELLGHFYVNWKYNGWANTIFHFFTMHLRVLFPHLWINK